MRKTPFPLSSVELCSLKLRQQNYCSQASKAYFKISSVSFCCLLFSSSTWKCTRNTEKWMVIISSHLVPLSLSMTSLKMTDTWSPNARFLDSYIIDICDLKLFWRVPVPCSRVSSSLTFTHCLHVSSLAQKFEQPRDLNQCQLRIKKLKPSCTMCSSLQEMLKDLRILIPCTNASVCTSCHGL